MDSDNYTIKELNEATMTMEKRIAETVREWEEEYNFRIADIVLERDPETFDVTSSKIPFFSPGQFV